MNRYIWRKTMLFVISFCFVFQGDVYYKLGDASKADTLIVTIAIHIFLIFRFVFQHDGYYKLGDASTAVILIIMILIDILKCNIV